MYFAGAQLSHKIRFTLGAGECGVRQYPLKIMDDYMKAIMPLTLTLLLSSCASVNDINKVSSPPEPISNKVSLDYYGSRNDLTPTDMAIYSTVIDLSKKRANTISTVSFPLSYAIYCDQERSQCKHAAVKTEIKYTTSTIGSGERYINGYFVSEMGEKAEFKSSLSSTGGQYTSISVPEGVPIISNEASKTPFKVALKSGETVELKGISGDLVVFQVQ